MARQPTAFGTLLRHYRARVSLTQAELAERAGLSVDAIIKLEGGKRQAPRCETVRILAGALGLIGRERRALEDAARPDRRGDAPLVGAPPEIAALLRCLTDLHAREAALIDMVMAATDSVDRRPESRPHH